MNIKEVLQYIINEHRKNSGNRPTVLELGSIQIKELERQFREDLGIKNHNPINHKMINYHGLEVKYSDQLSLIRVE